MATITGFTAERMLIIENASIVDGNVVGDNLILSRFDTTTIDAGSVRGPMGPSGDIPIGSIIDYIGITAPENYLTMIGQTVVDGETLYPDLWALLPASMKSGADIIMPNTRKCVSVGYDVADTDFNVIGKVGGSKTHTLTQAQLPAASITVDPPNTVVSVNPPNTTITVNPPNTAVTGNTGGQSATHVHTQGEGNFPYEQFGGGTNPSNYPTSTAQTNTGPNQTDHTHPAGTLVVDIAPFPADVDIAPFDINVNIAQFNSGNLGSGQAHNILQPYVTFLKIIRAA